MEKFLKCFCLPELFWIFLSLSFFLGAYLIYLILLFVGRRIFERFALGRELIETVKWPTLFILLEIATVATVRTLGLKGNFAIHVDHILNIIIIATIGWFFGAFARTAFKYNMRKMEQEALTNIERRSMFTQLLFLYRLTLFVIFCITLAAILMTFPYIKTVGIGLLGSAGILGIAVGIAARPILLNLIAGFQVVFTKTLKIDDVVHIEGESARIEALHLTHIVARTWDKKRIIVPVSYFIDKPFTNTDPHDASQLNAFTLRCDYRVSLDVIRNKVQELLNASPYWNKNSWGVQMINMGEQTMEVRVTMTADNVSHGFDLRCDILEKLVKFLQKEYPEMLPCVRYKEEI